MNVQTSMTITLTPDEVKGAIIETLLRLGYSAEPDQIVLQCTTENRASSWPDNDYNPMPVFYQALVNDPEQVRRE
jgi:hypothetical protein